MHFDQSKEICYEEEYRSKAHFCIWTLKVCQLSIIAGSTVAVMDDAVIDMFLILTTLMHAVFDVPFSRP
jgi:hypothetical protein